MTVDLPNEAAEMLRELAGLRETVARKRLADLRQRFPEIPDGEIEKLDSADLIMQALKREIAHQKTVAKDITQGKD